MNKTKKAAAARRYYVKHGARIRARVRAYANSPEGRDKISKYAKGVGRENVRRYSSSKKGVDGRKRRNKTPQYRLRSLARKKVAYAIKVGNIFKWPCQICCDINSFAHHIDYSRPLSVVWLCRFHHNCVHGR